MSVLNVPRILFKGHIGWDPGLSNNGSRYNARDATVNLPPNVGYPEFKEWSVNNTARDWNYYGTHTCAFSNVVVTGCMTSLTAGVTSVDALVGQPLRLRGRLVDLDPYTNWNSLVFGPELTLGGSSVLMSGRAVSPMNSRWLGRRVNVTVPIAGGFGVTFQACFDKDNLEFNSDIDSDTLRLFANSLMQHNCRGVMLRFSAYYTQYCQNGILNSISPQPRYDERRPRNELHELIKCYREGHVFSNPAYSFVVGAIGPWLADEPATVPAGRQLVPDEVQISPDNRIRMVNRAVAQVCKDSSVLSLDFNNTIRESDRALTKQDLGTLSCNIIDDQNSSVVERISIPYLRYDKKAYEQSGGIIDLPLSPTQLELLNKPERYRLGISADIGGKVQSIASEPDAIPLIDDREIYLDEAEQRDLEIHFAVRDPAVLSELHASIEEYEHHIYTAFGQPFAPLSKVSGAGSLIGGHVTSARGRGSVKLRVRAATPGLSTFRIRLFRTGETEPLGPPDLPSFDAEEQANAYFSIRRLPFDDELEKNTPDADLDTQFIYATVLRVYDLIFPSMAASIDMSDEVLLETLADRIVEITAYSKFLDYDYMPATRDLSRGKRKLIERWAQKLKPPAVAAALAERPLDVDRKGFEKFAPG